MTRSSDVDDSTLALLSTVMQPYVQGTASHKLDQILVVVGETRTALQEKIYTLALDLNILKEEQQKLRDMMKYNEETLKNPRKLKDELGEIKFTY
ncbi:hypothetical protein NDU88_004882 [Pleurodeles waltl]|uniref:Uncharacterized protein n=1 Tax=Pleurodeles waltl TaxID=8319 RepID=A0AAV7M7L5_PLEWA|nr:hypothetical protein NDU88_004882 [Pleurodeles waltl]